MSPETAAGLLLKGAAAVVSVVVARRRPDHRHVAGVLALSAVLDVSRALARETGFDLSAAVAHVGWHRVAIHVDRAAYLTWPTSLAWLSAVTFGKASNLRRSTLCIAAAWLLAVALLVVMYPLHRGPDTDHAIAGAEIASAFFSGGMLVGWWNRRGAVTLPLLVAFLIVGVHAAAFAVTARGYTPGRWLIAVGSYLVLYSMIVCIQGGVLCTFSSSESK